jgi:hypothetical protein
MAARRIPPAWTRDRLKWILGLVAYRGGRGILAKLCFPAIWALIQCLFSWYGRRLGGAGAKRALRGGGERVFPGDLEGAGARSWGWSLNTVGVCVDFATGLETLRRASDNDSSHAYCASLQLLEFW